MRTRAQIPSLLAAALVVGLTTASTAHNGGFTALAVPVDGIEVDGELRDWPESVPTYRVEGVLKGSPGYDGDDPMPEDLTAWFRVAWSQEAQRVYIAVEVRDDRIALGSSPNSTDALELYLDGSHGAQDPQQYLMFPGDATYALFGTSRNPTLHNGDIDHAGAIGAWSTHGDTVVYEWSAQFFEAYPEGRIRLEAGGRFGFDVVVVDRDQSGKGATWLSWSPDGGKVFNSDRLGDLVLLSSTEELTTMGIVQGRVVLPGTEDGWRGMQVLLFDDAGKRWAGAITGPGGEFEMIGPAGTVSLEVVDAEPSVSLELELISGQTVQPIIDVAQRRGSRLPLWPFAVTLGLFGAVALGSMLPLRKRLALLGGAISTPRATFAHLARHPEWTAPAALALLSASLASVAGINLYPGQLWGALMGMPGALSTILLLVLPLMMFLAIVVLQIGTWIAWSFLLWLGCHLAGGRGRFFHLVSATGYAAIPAVLGLCISALSVTFGWRGQSASLSHLTGLGALELSTGPMANVLAQVELFTLWSWALGAVGVAHVMGFTSRRAAAVTSICWAVTMVLMYCFHAGMRAVSADLAQGGL